MSCFSENHESGTLCNKGGGEKKQNKEKITEVNIAPPYTNNPNLLSCHISSCGLSISRFNFMKASDATGHRLDIITEELQFCDLNSKKEKS